MAVVFGADVQTPLAVPDPMTDYKMPVPGQLSYSAITGVGALAGTTGHDTLLLTGDRDRQMNGNESTRITLNRSHTVTGNQHKQISGNKDENIVGNFIHQTIGNLHRSIVGATNDLYTGVHAIQHAANQLLQEPVQYIHYVEEHLNKGIDYYQTYGFYESAIGQYLNLVGVNTDLKGVQLGYALKESNGVAFKDRERGIEITTTITETNIHSIDSHIGAVQPGVYAAMMHEVAFTQKIITVGINQWT